MTQKTAVPPDWYLSYFGNGYPEAVRTYVTPQRTRTELTFLRKHIGVDPGAQLLDAACGRGRHSLGLARFGYDVTGVDVHEPSIKALQQEAGKRGLTVRTVHTDLRTFRSRAKFDGALCMFHSFGYLPTDADNERALASIAAALRRRAKLVLQVPNRERVFIDAMVPLWERTVGGMLLTTEHRVNLRDSRLEGTEHRMFRNGRRVALPRSIRIYSLKELTDLARQLGLVVESVWGGPDECAYTVESREMLVVLEKG